MEPITHVSRHEFLATTGAVVAASGHGSQLSANAAESKVPLAINGGPKAVKEMGLSDMDYSKVSLPETEGILKTSVRMVINDSMTESWAASIGDGIRKVAEYYAS